MPTTTFTEKARLAAVRRVESGKATIAEQAKKTGCSPSTLRGWVRRYGTAVEDSAPQPDPDPPAAPKRDVVFDLHAHGARPLHIFGMGGMRVLIEMPTEEAEALFPEALAASSRTRIFEGVEQDIASIATGDKDLATSALAGTALALALEIENPYNSATSKAMCSGQLRETLDRLRELAPPEEERDAVDDLTAARAARRSAGRAASPDLPRPAG